MYSAYGTLWRGGSAVSGGLSIMKKRKKDFLLYQLGGSCTFNRHTGVFHTAPA